MKYSAVLFFISLLAGTVIRIPIAPGVYLYWHDITLFILLCTFLFSKKNTTSPVVISPVVYFVGTAVLSLVINTYRFSLEELFFSSFYLIRWIYYFLIYIVVSKSTLSRTFWKKGLYAVGVGFAVIGLAQYFLYPDLRNLEYLGWDPHYFRVFTTLLDPNFSGLLFVFTLFLGASVNVFQVLVLVALFLTYSRSSYVAFFAGLVVYLISTKRSKWIAPIVLTFIAVLFLLPTPFGEGVDLWRTVSTYARFANWQQGFGLFLQAPIFGHGFNTLGFIQSFGLDSSVEFVAVTTGLVGLVAYGYMFWTLAKKRNALYLATLIALFVHSFFVNSAFYPWIMIWIWILSVDRQRA